MAGNNKMWRWGIGALSVGAIGVSVAVAVRSGDSGVRWADEVIMADVATGELFAFPVDGRRGIMVPARHPESATVSLLPVVERDGKWYLGARERNAVKRLDVEPAAVDPGTGEVRIVNPSPKRVG